MSNQQRLAAFLARYAYQEGDFVLSSGARSTFYLDAKQVTYHPDAAGLVGTAVYRLATEFGAEAIGGLTMGADAIVTSTVIESARAGRPMPGFVVRKEPKGHGLQKWIEGISPAGKRVAIVDDVITYGSSVLRAIKAASQAQAKIAVVIGLVDREEGGRDAIEKTGVPFRAICTLSDIRALAARAAVA
ncbi:MAG: orotate phosphoribosyltransferase [Gemmatimonadaceae bacterium]